MADPTSPSPRPSSTPTGRSTPAQHSLDKARAAWQRLQERARGTDCTHPSTALYRIPAADGSIQIDYCCTVCEARVGNRSIAHRALDHNPALLPVAGSDRVYVNPPCQVCGNFGTQLHHWAPKEVFGPVEADHWPTSYLCVRCHSDWHKRINDHYSDAGRPF